MIINRLK